MTRESMPGAIAALPPLRDIINAHGLRAEKKLGQNFLLDLNVTAKIARAARVTDGAYVVEIGPGPGGLTRALLGTGAAGVTAVEYDPRAVAALQSLVHAADGRLAVVQADALGVDAAAMAPAPRYVVANLPYNIATPLLLGWLRQWRADPGAFAGLTLMFQKEVALRLVAKPMEQGGGGKAYGRLAVMTQWLCAAQRLFDLPPSVFMPPPKVTSSVVQFTPLTLPADAPPFAAMERVVGAAFGQRRKMLRSALGDLTPLLAAAGIDGTRRAEELSVSEFVRLAQAEEKIFHRGDAEAQR